MTLRMSCRRSGRLTNGFSKCFEPHLAAVSLYVAHYNLCRVHGQYRGTGYWSLLTPIGPFLRTEVVPFHMIETGW